MVITDWLILALGILIGIIGCMIGKKKMLFKRSKVLTTNGIDPNAGYLSLELGINWFYPSLVISREKAENVEIGEEVSLSDLVDSGDNVIVAYGNAINVSTKKKDDVRVTILDKALVNGLLMLSGELVDKKEL